MTRRDYWLTTLMFTMKHISRAIVFASLVGMAAPVIALGAFHEQLKEQAVEKREKIQQEREELKQKIEEKRDGLKERTTAIKQDFEVKRTVAREQVQAEIKKVREDFKTKAEARKVEMKKKFGEMRSQRIEQFFSKMTEKFESAIDRLDRMAEKIQARIDAASANGRDMTNAKADLAIAQTKIDEAEKILVDAKAKYAELGASMDVKKKFAEVKTLVQGVEQEIKNAHGALVRVIANMKGMGTTTATTTPNQ